MLVSRVRDEAVCRLPASAAPLLAHELSISPQDSLHLRPRLLRRARAPRSRPDIHTPPRLCHTPMTPQLGPGLESAAYRYGA